MITNWLAIAFFCAWIWSNFTTFKFCSISMNSILSTYSFFFLSQFNFYFILFLLCGIWAQILFHRLNNVVEAHFGICNIEIEITWHIFACAIKNRNAKAYFYMWKRNGKWHDSFFPQRFQREFLFMIKLFILENGFKLEDFTALIHFSYFKFTNGYL